MISTSADILLKTSSRDVPPRSASYSAASSHISRFLPSFHASIPSAEENGTAAFARDSVGSTGARKIISEAPALSSAARIAVSSGFSWNFAESSALPPRSSTLIKSGAGMKPTAAASFCAGKSASKLVEVAAYRDGKIFKARHLYHAAAGGYSLPAARDAAARFGSYTVGVRMLRAVVELAEFKLKPRGPRVVPVFIYALRRQREAEKSADQSQIRALPLVDDRERAVHVEVHDGARWASRRATSAQSPRCAPKPPCANSTARASRGL